ncbi:MAG: FtsX-like permease family protein [Angelakisella sp.]|jgi:ABC-type antimicrobial peptide transport system permease subunit|nr:FtsX-like permease family protein [Angelakisella sp.]
MRLTEILRLVWINIMENKFKVLLTSLGIIVGAATIVLVIAIGQGSKADVADQFKNLSAGAIEVRYQASMQGMENQGGPGGGMPGGFPGGFPGGGMSGGGNRGGMPGGVSGGSRSGSRSMMGSPFAGVRSNVDATLTYEDVDEIALFVPDITTATISASGSYGVLGYDMEEEEDYTVVGVYAAYAQVTNLELSLGDFIAGEDTEDLSRVCVLGSRVCEEIFGTAALAYNSVLTIDGRDYTIIGVLDSMGTVSSGISPDSAVYLPYTTAEKYLFGSAIQPTITVLAEDVAHVPQVMENLEITLSDIHPGVTYTITDAGSSMEAATKSANTMSLLLVAIASIVFIVGGIGIMNVLFVSVQERTREIGILKALGCSRGNILTEFLMESNMISTFGGIVGVAVGSALMPVLSRFQMRVELSVGGVLMALVFAILTGTLFGFYPAAKAAALVPIEALNHE